MHINGVKTPRPPSIRARTGPGQDGSLDPDASHSVSPAIVHHALLLLLSLCINILLYLPLPSCRQPFSRNKYHIHHEVPLFLSCLLSPAHIPWLFLSSDAVCEQLEANKGQSKILSTTPPCLVPLNPLGYFYFFPRCVGRHSRPFPLFLNIPFARRSLLHWFALANRWDKGKKISDLC